MSLAPSIVSTIQERTLRAQKTKKNGDPQSPTSSMKTISWASVGLENSKSGLPTPTQNTHQTSTSCLKAATSLILTISTPELFLVTRTNNLNGMKNYDHMP